MSQNIGKFMCRVCGSLNVTFDPTNEIVICNICGHTESIRTYIPDVTYSGSVVAGTVPPEPVVKTEEVFGYRRTTQEVFPHTHEEFKNIERDMDELKNRVNKIDSKVEELRGISPKVIIVEEVPKEEAKRRVEDFLRDYMKRHENVYPSDVADELGLKYELVREIFDILEKEGKLEKKAK